jgi:hypothetical protein
MTGALFLLDVLAFVLLVYWTYRSAARPEAGEEGLFGMKSDPQAPDPETASSSPRWRRARLPAKFAQSGGRLSSVRAGRRPRWRTALSADRGFHRR